MWCPRARPCGEPGPRGLGCLRCPRARPCGGPPAFVEGVGPVPVGVGWGVGVLEGAGVDVPEGDGRGGMEGTGCGGGPWPGGRAPPPGGAGAPAGGCAGTDPGDPPADPPTADAPREGPEGFAFVAGLPCCFLGSAIITPVKGGWLKASWKVRPMTGSSLLRGSAARTAALRVRPRKTARADRGLDLHSSRRLLPMPVSVSCSGGVEAADDGMPAASFD